MKSNVKMKALAVAVLGLAGVTFAGASMAVCPTDPAAPAGPWTSKSVVSATLAITTPGLVTTECAMSVSLSAGATILAKAFVTDTTPADEPRYRVRFYFDTTALTGLDSALKQLPIFTASSATSPPAKASDELKAVLIGGGTVGAAAPSLRIIVADSNQGSGFNTVTIALPTALGVNRFEADLTQGATGSVRYWLTSGATVTTDGAPTGTFAVNNSGWSGVTQASLGAFSASNQYRTGSVATQVLKLDELDSRRQTFIGL